MDRSHANLLLLAIFTATVVSCYGNEEFSSDATASTSKTQEELQFTYKIVDKRTDIPCTLANMSITLHVAYKTKTDGVATRELKVPSDAKVTGKCDSTTDIIGFSWQNENKRNNSIKLVLLNDHTFFSLFSVEVSVYLDPENFPDAADIKLYELSELDLGLFSARTDDGRHSCPGDTKIEINEYVNLTITDVSLIAFNHLEDYSSRKEVTCREGTRIKAFPYVIKHNSERIKYLARMKLSLDISYVTTNDSIKQVTVPFYNFATLSTGYLYYSKHYDLRGYLTMWMWITWNSYFEIKFSIFETSEENIYISDVYIQLILTKEFLNDAKEPFTRVGNWRFNLFPMDRYNGIYSCPSGITLNLGDAILTISDVLLTLDQKSFPHFSRKIVIDCRTEEKITEEDFNYVVKAEGQNVPCILANMSISIFIPYRNRTHHKFAVLTVPSYAKTEGFCDYSMSKMALTWTEPKGYPHSNSFALYLSRDSDQFSVSFMEADVYFDEENFPDMTGIIKRSRFSSAFNLGMFVGPVENTIYQCTDGVEKVPMGHSNVTIRNITLAPFNEQKDMGWKLEYVCPKNIETTTTETPTTTTTPHFSENGYMYVARYTDRNVACILANMNISFKVRYDTKQSGEKESILNVPSERVEVEGECNSRNPSMTLVWSEDPSTHVDASYQNRVTLSFMGDDTSCFLRTVRTDIYLDAKNFPDASDSRWKRGIYELTLFYGIPGWIIKCNLETIIQVSNIQVTFNNVSLIAFNNYPDVSNRLETTCREMNPSATDPWTGLQIASCVCGGVFIIGLIVSIAFVVAQITQKKYSSR